MELLKKISSLLKTKSSKRRFKKEEKEKGQVMENKID